MVAVRDLGLMAYAEAHRLQRDLVERLKSDGTEDDVLLFVEHPDVYTYGRKSGSDFRAPAGTTAYAVERGGDVTFHNPGQLVAYPLLRLGEGERDILLHLRRLEQVLIDVLAEWDIKGETRAGLTGVWLQGQEKKIASLGVAASGWVTYHGVALNVSNDLTGFGRVNPCGLSSQVMISMAEVLGDETPPLAEVKAAFLRHFSRRFERPTRV